MFAFAIYHWGAFHNRYIASHETKEYISINIHANKHTVVPSAHNPDVERDPPPPLTPLDFPIHSPSTPASAFDSRPCENLPKILLSIKKPSDITSAHVDSFKIKLTRDVEFSAIIPSNGQSYLPPLKWWEGDLDSDDGCAVSDSTPPNRPKLNNGNTAPRESQYESIKKELLFSNTDCYRVLQRLPEKEGRPNVRLTDTRKFYLGLHQMSEYWDSSLDQFTTEMGTDDSPPKSKYKGLRSSTGREMPEQYRDATVRAFVEMVAWPFKCQIITPTVLPRLAVQSMYFPVRYSLQVNRSPLDRALGRSGHQEGPIMAIQCRPETKFREEGDAPGHGNAEMVDLLREVAVMLLLAQERAREGTTETRQGEGKWWTTVPRWGGGPGGEMGNEEPNSDEIASAKLGSSPLHHQQQQLGERPRKKPTSGAMLRKKAMADKWRALQPGASNWSRKMKYLAIGKDRASEYDDVCPLPLPSTLMRC
jgi:hypothetical protein